jgi:predicted PurR-regulated permease PerM
VAAALSTTLVLSLVLVPTITVSVFAVVEASRSVRRVDLNEIRERLDRLRQALGLSMPLAEQWQHIDAELNHAFFGGPSDTKKSLKPVAEDIVARFDGLVAELDYLGIAYDEESKVALRDSLQAILQKEPGTIDYDAAVQEALRNFESFQQDALGGPLWTTLKRIANPSDEQLRSIALTGVRSTQAWLLSVAGDTTAFVGKMLIGLMIVMVATYFFFMDGPRMVDHVMSLAPLDADYQRELLIEFDRVSRAVAVATLLSAIAQGVLGGLGYYFAGLHSVFLLTLLTTVFAMVPFIGAAAIWVPCCLWLALIDDRWLAAGLLATYGTFGISMIDNVVKPWVLHGQSRLHPLIALLSVLGGVQALGPIGIMVGPMVVVFLVTLLKILQRELTKLERLPWTTNEPQVAATNGASGRTEGAT